ncbi:alkaline phosphatase family protein [Sporomusa sp.]|uniref:alkaline phosphatase family protein n=1 Tax=Sporomusa sp. TaxID=2078658 RepID=UPI002B7EB32A|nr:alkaline phosphatase family protein [Sporomusa sp.]HWR44587.1 alkaline phosphatase family protein [Sporomusa sp.]
MRVLLLFIDGFGLGSNNPEINPIVRFGLHTINQLFDQPMISDIGLNLTPECCMIPIDTTLGVEGLPQSATGQAAILTGLNTAKAMGRHIQAFPGPQLSNIITENNIMKRLTEAGMLVTSANMYTPNYFELVAKRKRRHSAITLAALSTGMSLRSLPEMYINEAVYQDITNVTLPDFGVDHLPVLSPTQAACNLVNISRKYSFTIFEYFQTDRAGHKQDWLHAGRILRLLDEFIGAVYKRLPADTLMIITSDHGNFEDMSVKTHTFNKVPLIALGYRAQETVGAITDLTGIAPAIVAVLGKDDPCD